MENIKTFLHVISLGMLLINSVSNYIARKELEAKFDLLELKLKLLNEQNEQNQHLILKAIEKSNALLAYKLQKLSEISNKNFEILRAKQDGLKSTLFEQYNTIRVTKDSLASSVNNAISPGVEQSSSLAYSLVSGAFTAAHYVVYAGIAIGLIYISYQSYSYLNSVADSLIKAPLALFTTPASNVPEVSSHVRAPSMPLPKLDLNPLDLAPPAPSTSNSLNSFSETISEKSKIINDLFKDIASD